MLLYSFRLLKHENIVEMYGVSYEEIDPVKKNVCIVMERLDCDMKSKIDQIQLKGSKVSKEY